MYPGCFGVGCGVWARSMHSLNAQKKAALRRELQCCLWWGHWVGFSSLSSQKHGASSSSARESV